MKLEPKTLFLIFIISLSNLLIINSQSVLETAIDADNIQATTETNLVTETKIHLPDSNSNNHTKLLEIKDRKVNDDFELKSKTAIISFINEVLFYWFQHP